MTRRGVGRLSRESTARRRPRAPGVARATVRTRSMEPDGPEATPASSAARASAKTHVVLFAWLGLIHVNVAVVVVACAFWPRAEAVAALVALVTLAAWPRARKAPSWGEKLARTVTRTACAYFPSTLAFEDEEEWLEATRCGRPSLIGLEPHGVLPLSVISFAEYFIYDEPEEAKRKRLTETTRRSRCLASAAIFNVPFVRHLWTWLGLDPISRSRMLKMLRGGESVVIIPGGVAECMTMEKGVETLYLRKRFGFVKIAIQTGAALVPAYTFGQSRTYGYWRLGPPIVPKFIADWIGKTFAFAPIVFWGKWCTPIPYATPLNTIIGKPLEVVKNPDPSREEVAAKLEEFIDAMRSLYERHKSAYGYANVDLVIY